MDNRESIRYCPRCQADQPTFSFGEAADTPLRCLICGFPVEVGLVRGPSETQRPPDIRILCIDDDPLIRRMFGEILRLHGFVSLEAADGSAGLEAATRERPDLILLDIMMPDLDGFEVCRRLKADPDLRTIPVIILTAMNDPALNSRAFQVGAELALRKPAEAATVLRTIEAALGLSLRRPRSEPEYASAAAGRQPEPGAEASVDLGVPTRPEDLLIWTVDGLTLNARIFLHLDAATHGGPETVQDRLNDPNLFLTLTLPGEAPLLFLNKIQIIRVDLPAEQPTPLDTLGPADATEEPVRIHLVNGERLEGSIRIEGPEGKRRLSDFLNTQPTFLPLHGRERLHLLQKRFIVRILPTAA